MGKRTNSDIILGSGIPYVMEYDAAAGMPDVKTICVEENRLGYTKGGAALSYMEETHEESDDLNYVTKVITTKDDASLKLGLLTYNGKTLEKLADRCKVTEDETAGTRTIHLGGAGNAQGKEWVVCFFHEDKKSGNLWVLIRGRNTAGFTFKFAMDAGSVIEPEFKALPQDDKGTKVTLIEEIDKKTA